MNTIEISKLTKFFGKQKALDGVDLIVKEGEIYGFIGPNGAGKSTTIRILLGMLQKDSGDVRLLGGDPWTDAVKLHEHIAYVPGDVTLWPNLTGGEVINFLGRLHGNIDSAKQKELIETFQLDIRKKCKSYSKGNRQKVALIAALSSNAKMLILDEPTSGLDPLMELIFQDYIHKAKKEGKTVFLSSHILAEVEAVCDKIGIIRQGKIVESGTLDDLRHLTRTTLTVELKSDLDLNKLEGIHDISHDRGKVRFSADSENLDHIISKLSASGIKSLTAEPPALEELFMRHYEKNEGIMLNNAAHKELK
ncbi:ABC transporter ATP-binding protein [Sedimentibacter saalensis]|jgi:ABC-2 type transport system ATP-binding protein|uniref:ABC-2 type transport system ATP-binding protein n=1 Tax=Sedimentibacter saalensis TaxID=130788 RepID=A0A562JB68_9FIRM|nr:ABC transporter ATP-binding protein [Sedimentibacter saalensis]TWH80458.1 ABC-2 type transport system ATP-binding protein [Sedimentibacter saalensis]